MATEEGVAKELGEIFNFTELSSGRELLSRLEHDLVDDTKSYFIDFIKNLPVLLKFGESEKSTLKMIRGQRRKTNNVLEAEKKIRGLG